MNDRLIRLAVLSGLLCLGLSLPAQIPTWQQFASSPPGTSPRNDDIHFVDPLHGWAARATDGIYRTTNGGVTFEKVRAGAFTYPGGATLTAHFRSINFASRLRGWAGNLGPGSYDASVTDTNLLFETFDGGTTWTPVAAVNASDMQGFCSLQVLDSGHIYGGGRVRGPAHFARSTDGGTNWTVTNLTAAGIMGGIMDVYFHDPLTGYLVGMDTNAYAASCGNPYRGTIARTMDGGLTWSNVITTAVTCSYFWKMSWPSSNVGYVTLQQNGAHDTVIYYKTTDGGATWVSNGIPIVNIGGPSFGLQGIGFVSEMEGWMGGSTSVAAPYNFIRTTDGGATWTPVGYDNTQSINRIRFLNANFGYASGRKLHVYRVVLALTAGPTNQTVNAGDAASFSVTAQGFPPHSYQWRFHGTNLAGAMTNSLVITNVQAANAGSYDVVVSDYSGSVTSAPAELTVTGPPVAPEIVVPPQGLLVAPGGSAAFTVVATGTAPLSYQWQFNGAAIGGATNVSYTRTNVQPPDAGNYSVQVSNPAGSVTSAAARLTLGFTDDFDSYAGQVVTSAGSTNGYKIVYRSASGPVDFRAVFGFDYSTVVYPTNIPPAPNSVSGTTKGLLLTVNKDATAAAAAVNLYPIGKSFTGDHALKFDLWINWANPDTSTEHTLFGINHSGDRTNRVGQPSSDGLFFAMAGEDDSTPNSSVLRDFSAFRGGGSGAPVLLTTNNTVFGPAPLLAPQFENYNPGFGALFPSQTIPGYGVTPAGTAGLRWVRGEVRQSGDLITWLLNDTIVAQCTNTYGYSAGTVLLGYNDHYSSIGDSNNFAIFDNLRVVGLTRAPVQILSPMRSGNEFRFSFVTEPGESYTVERGVGLNPASWSVVTNLVGTGASALIAVPLGGNEQFFRVSRP